MEESYGLQDYSIPGDIVKTVDPVCGMTVEQDKAEYHTGYEGETFYFCSRNCQREFEHEPARFIARRQP